MAKQVPGPGMGSRDLSEGTATVITVGMGLLVSVNSL